MIIQLLWEKILWFLISIYILIFIVLCGIFFINIKLNFLIITNKKIISIKQLSFLNKEIHEIPFENIQTMQIKISGIFPTIFQYGTLEILTSNTTGNLRFHYIHQPNKALKNIYQIIEENTKK